MLTIVKEKSSTITKLQDIKVGTLFTWGNGEFPALRTQEGYFLFTSHQHFSPRTEFKKYRELNGTLTIID